MDFNKIPGSLIVEVSRLAFASPDVEFLCFGESDQVTPLVAREAAIAALNAGERRHTDVHGLPELREKLASYLSNLHARPVPEDRIQVTASGMTAISVALSAIVRPGDRVVVHSPVWPNIANAVRLRGGEPEFLPLIRQAACGFHLDLNRLDAMLQGARLFILNSPNNPTGWTATRDELRAILEIARRRHVWLISDEVYSRLVYDGTAAAPSLLDLAQDEDRVVVCNSFSKAWVMTGWRLGWMVLPRGTRDDITEIVEVTHSGVAAFIQRAAVAVLQDPSTAGAFRAYCAAGRAQVSQALAGLSGIRYTPPAGAFYAFLGVEGLTDSLGLAKRLVRGHGVAVAPGAAFGAAGEGFLRVCFAQSHEKMARAMQRLRDGIRMETTG